MIETYTDQLRDQGYRMTPQRLAILRILDEGGYHLTPLEIYQRASQKVPGLTEATVYRTLNFLTRQGIILAAHVGNGQLVYELAEHAHHHLICRRCSGTHEIDHSLLEDLYKQFQTKTGYQIDSIHVTFFGLCPDCQE
jgi:Fe2+ or Zn2+ uptake regulation protein